MKKILAAIRWVLDGFQIQFDYSWNTTYLDLGIGFKRTTLEEVYDPKNLSADHTVEEPWEFSLNLGPLSLYVGGKNDG